MSKLKLILVRHGYVEGIKPKKFCGWIDLPLTSSGIAQAEATARHLQDVHPAKAVYASPLSRCVDTANIVGKPQNLTASPVPEFIDIGYGAWQGRNREDVARAEPERFHHWMTVPHLTVLPDAETLQDVQARLIRALQVLRECHDGETIITVGHDSSNRIFLLSALDISLPKYWTIRQDPCCINLIEIDGERCSVNKINETVHLHYQRSGDAGVPL